MDDQRSSKKEISSVVDNTTFIKSQIPIEMDPIQNAIAFLARNGIQAVLDDENINIPQAERRRLKRIVSQKKYRQKKKAEKYEKFKNDPCGKCSASMMGRGLAYKRHRKQ